MTYRNQWMVKSEPRNEPYLQPVNGIVQPPVIPPPNRPGRRTNVLDSLKSVLNAISRKRWAIHFRNPVDSKALGVPDYHTLIKRPMDLSTIRKRLNNNYYCQASEAIEDFTLIFENCMRFNKEGTVVHQAGEELKSFFHMRLSMIDLTNEVEVEVEVKPKPKPKPKPGKRKKAFEETPFADPKGFTPDLHQSRSKRFCPGLKINLNLPSLRTAFVPDTLVKPPPSSPSPSPPPPPPPLPIKLLPPLICYKTLDRMIEQSYFQVLLKVMMKRKRRHITWPFNRAESWVHYSHNLDYDHSPEERLDWPILEGRVNSDDFQSFDSFVALTQQMFQNGLRCFPEEGLIRSNIMETISVFETTLERFKLLVSDKKKLARVMVAEELKKMEGAEGSSGSHWKLLPLDNAALKESQVPKKAPPPPVKQLPPLICYKDLDRMIELSHCKVLLKIMMKRKRRHITWPFNRAEYWAQYSHNDDYDHSIEGRLDWPILEDRLNTHDFKSLDSFVALVHQMFQNGLRCFPEEGLIRSNIMETISVFDATLVRFRELVKNKKDLARVLVAEELQKQGTGNSTNSTMPDTAVSVQKETDPPNRQWRSR